MSAGDVGLDSGPGICESCRHTARNCPQCGGWEQYPAPPAPAEKRCLRCISKIAASGDVSSILDPVGVRMAWMSLMGFAPGQIVEDLATSPPTSIEWERAQYEAAWRQEGWAAPVSLDEPTEILGEAESIAIAQALFAATQDGLNQLAEQGDMLPLGEELLLIDDDSTTVSQPAEQVAPDVVATLAPLQPTWRGLLVECSALLNAIAAKDPAAAAGHVRRFRELLTAAAQYGS